MTPATLTADLLAAVAVAEAVLLGRLLFLGYYRSRRYPFFVVLVAADLAQTVAGWLGIVPIYSAAYWWFWASSEIVVVALQILAAREIYIRIWASYPGIDRLGRNLAEWAFLLALFLSLATLFVDVWRVNWHAPTWSGGLVLRRAIATVLAIAVAFAGHIVRWAPEPVPRNVERHARIFAGYLATSALFWLLAAVRALSPGTASVFKLAFAALWFVAWTWAFRRDEDDIPRLDGAASEIEIDDAIGSLRNLAEQLRDVVRDLFRYRSKNWPYNAR